LSAISIRLIILLIINVAFYSCQPEKEKIIGHWHSLTDKSGNYYSVDFSDSLESTNKLSDLGWQEEHKRRHNEVILYPILLEPISNIKIHTNTLIVNDEYAFVKVKEHQLTSESTVML
jgi:hypothetical protein